MPPPRVRRLALRVLGVVALAYGAAAAAIAGDGLVDERARCDVAVVLGARVREDGRPSVQLADRLRGALAVWRRGEAALLVVSGGKGVEGHEEADVMAAWLVAEGVPRDRIVVDREGWTTWHTAVNTRRLLDERGLASAIVVTSYYHVPRARLAFSRAGIRRVATARAPYRVALRDAWSLPREVAAYAWYAAR